jgi:hypothetical protein
MTLGMEKAEWKPFRNALDKSEKKQFEEMWDIPRLYVSACSNSCQLVPLQPIIISILFHHYKELKKCRFELDRLQGKVNSGNSNSNKDKEQWTIKEEEKEEVPIDTLDGYFIQTNANYK